MRINGQVDRCNRCKYVYGERASPLTMKGKKGAEAKSPRSLIKLYVGGDKINQARTNQWMYG